MRCGGELVQPLVELMIALRVKQSRAIHTDDTPVPIQSPGQKRCRQGRIWCYLGDEANPYTVYDYTPRRTRDGPARWLQGYQGYLQADAYGGYDGIYSGGHVTEVACWAHARRKFYDAQDSDPHRAAQMLALVAELYTVEREAKYLNDASRLALRQARSAPVLARIKEWLDAEGGVVLPRGPMGLAIQYAQNQWDALTVYTTQGYLNIDNNASERALNAWPWVAKTGSSPAMTPPPRTTRGSGRSSPVASDITSIPSATSPASWPRSAPRPTRNSSSSCPTSGDAMTKPSRFPNPNDSAGQHSFETALRRTDTSIHQRPRPVTESISTPKTPTASGSATAMPDCSGSRRLPPPRLARTLRCTPPTDFRFIAGPIPPGTTVPSAAQGSVILQDKISRFAASPSSPFTSTGSGLTGDYNGNGQLDAADYVLRQAAGTNTPLLNDPLGGTIGPAEYQQWRTRFGASGSGSSLANGATVPEPSGWWISLVALAFGTAMCRKVVQHNIADQRYIRE